MKQHIAVKKQKFQDLVLQWYVKNHRDFPWRNTENPFHILIAEICLQKTGAQKAEPAYKTIVSEFSTPAMLAQADPSLLLSIFKPMGLSNRAKLLIQIAQQIDKDFSGKMPGTYEDLVKIKGVGQYIANAILVFAFAQRAPLVDEGIARIYRRVFGIKRLKSAYADKKLWIFAEEMTPYSNVKEYIWGLLDLSALICKPKQPYCKDCPLITTCLFVKQAQV